MDRLKTYEPVGRCIYCGATSYASDSRRFLAAEHVIPFGLGGQILLPQASCRSCERKTGQQESRLMRGALLGCRTILNLPTRSPKDRPKSLPLYVGEQKRRVMVNVEDYPATLFLLGFSYPPYLSGAPSGSATYTTARILRRNPAVLRYRYGIVGGYSTPGLDTHPLQYTLAKIAHSFSVAELGLSTFEPVLLDMLLEATKPPSIFVGGTAEMPPKSSERHELSFQAIDGRPELVAVRIRLFADLDMPAYLVITGTR